MISNELLLETPVEQLEAIARRFKKLRLAANVRQSDLAKRSGVGVATIRRFEAGGNISVLNLARLIKLGVRVHFLSFFDTSGQAAQGIVASSHKYACNPSW